MAWPSTPSSDAPAARRAAAGEGPAGAPGERARPSPLGRVALGIPRERRATPPPPAALIAAALLAPAAALAHERWVPNTPRFPVNRAFFQAMEGEVLVYSLGASVAVFGLIVLWYLSAPGIVEALTPHTPSARAHEARRSPLARLVRGAIRFALDGAVESRFMAGGLRVMTFVFARIPAFVLALGAYQGWLVMPSYPLPAGTFGLAVRIVEAALALWVASGLLLRPLGAVMFAVYAYLCFAYGIAGVDAIPVLASAFFYVFSARGGGVNARQLLGMRVCLGLGFFLLGVVNKIYLGPDLFIGVGDNKPELLASTQALFPGLTREAWSYTTALGEMVFGLLLFIGAFNRLTTLVLTFVFANFMAVFGLAEVVHVYPIAGFLLLFFRGPLGTSLDGIVFRTNVALWRRLKSTSYRLIYGGAVTAVAGATGVLFMFLPLLLVTEVVPGMAGSEVPRGYRPPPLPPPASEWPPLAPSAAAPHADHEPRHGGVVTMTGDQHVEIVVRRDGAIQLFLSDAVRAPIPAREGRGTVRVERAGAKPVVVAVLPDAAGGALVGAGPPPTARAEYTYLLEIRGVDSSTTLVVPPGGTDPLVRRSSGDR